MVRAPGSANGHGKPMPLVHTHPDPPRRWPPLSLASLVTAVLVLLLFLGGLVLLRETQRLRFVRDHLASLTAPESEIAGTSDAAPLTAEELWETPGADSMPLFHPFGVAVAPDGALWVADGVRSQFQIFAPDGTFRETWGTPGAGNGQFSFTGSGDVAFDAAGNIYVVDTDNDRIQKFSPERAFLTAWGSQGSGAGQFLGPQFITIGPDGDVYVTDDKRNDIQRFDATGHYLNTIGEPGSGDGQLNSPGGVAIDRDGSVWVSDYNNNRIEQFAPDGTFLHTWGSGGNRAGELSLPNDIAFDAQGRIYVLESGNKRVQVFDREFQSVLIFGREDLSAQGLLSDAATARRVWFDFPAAMALDAQGHVYLTDTMGNVLAAFRVLPSAPAAGDAPAAPGESDAILMQGPVASVPDKELWLGLEQVTLEPGAEWALDDGDGVGPLLYQVEAGSLTVTPDGDSTITRAGTTRAETVAAGSTVTLQPGDQAFHPSGVAPHWRNAGQEPVSLLEARVTTIGNSVPPAGCARYPLVTGSAFPPLPTPLLFAVHRLNLSPHASFATDTTPGLTLLYIESGQLNVHDTPPNGAGASPATPTSFTIVNGVDAVRTFPPGRVYQAGDTPATVLLLTLTRPNPLEETPMS